MVCINVACGMCDGGWGLGGGGTWESEQAPIATPWKWNSTLLMTSGWAVIQLNLTPGARHCS